MSFFDPAQLELFWPLVLALALGALVGFEREYVGKSAGVRTNALICLGAALFTVLSLNVPQIFGEETVTSWDPSRIAAQVVIGVGFLGAGVVIFRQSRIRGLTTAATMWVVAAIGIAVGRGFYREALFSVGVVYCILTFLWLIEKKMGSGLLYPSLRETDDKEGQIKNNHGE